MLRVIVNIHGVLPPVIRLHRIGIRAKISGFVRGNTTGCHHAARIAAVRLTGNKIVIGRIGKKVPAANMDLLADSIVVIILRRRVLARFIGRPDRAFLCKYGNVQCAQQQAGQEQGCAGDVQTPGNS